MFEQDNDFENFRTSLSEYIKNSRFSRKNSYKNKCLSASINEKQPQKKIAVLVG